MTHKDLDRAEAWFARRGEPFVLIGRFIPLLRSFVSFAAGLGEMALAKFTIFTVIGCAVWCTALCSLGYSLGSSYNHVLKAFSDAGYVLGALAVLAVAVVIWHRVHEYRKQRAIWARPRPRSDLIRGSPDGLEAGGDGRSLQRNSSWVRKSRSNQIATRDPQFLAKGAQGAAKRGRCGRIGR